MNLDNQIETAITEAKTTDRKDLPVVDLQHMASRGDETPVSGDALTLHEELAWERLEATKHLTEYHARSQRTGIYYALLQLTRNVWEIVRFGPYTTARLDSTHQRTLHEAKAVAEAFDASLPG